jgi:hypothetical protein
MDFCLARGRRFCERLEKARIVSRPPERSGVEKARECEPKSFSGAVVLAWGLQVNSALLSSGAAGS